MGGTCCQAKREDQGENLEFNEGETANRRLKKCLTHEEFVSTLTGGGKHAKINMDLIETVLLIPDDDEEIEVEEDTQPKKKVRDRKSTGFVTKNMVEAANARATFAEEEEEEEKKPLSATGARIKGRKGTGFVSKQKLLEVLDDIDDDEEEAPKPKAKESKIQQRKNTGFVTKEKLRKLLATFGEDEE
mmetsp:Transcript_160158/g.295187  ORF Transcript_160158/g.295187 Transcript_160158/m.295187 type:complete len:188 (+) Transcript_160158:84-647(+)